MPSLSNSHDEVDANDVVQEVPLSVAVLLAPTQVDSSNNIAAAGSNAAARQIPAPDNGLDVMADGNVEPPHILEGLSEAAEDHVPSNTQQDLAQQADQCQIEDSGDGVSKDEAEEETYEAFVPNRSPALIGNSEQVDDDLVGQQTNVPPGRSVSHNGNYSRMESIEQIECDGIGPYLPPSICFGGAIINKEPNVLQPLRPFRVSDFPPEEDILVKSPNENCEATVEHIDDDGTQSSPGIVVGHGQTYEARACDNARASIEGIVNEDHGVLITSIIDSLLNQPTNQTQPEDLESLITENNTSLSSQPSDQTQPSAAATHDQLSVGIPPVYPQITDVPRFYAVEARLVSEPSSSSELNASEPELTTPVYDAVFIPNQSSLSWWKRKRARYGGIMVVTVGLISSAFLVNSRNKGGGGEGDGPVAKISQPPPFTCDVSNLGKVYDDECEYCYHAMAMGSGDASVMTENNEESLGIYILSKLGGAVNVSLTPSVGNFYPAPWAGTLASSEDVVVAGDWYFGDDASGAIFVYEKDPSGMWNQTMQIIPNNVESDSKFGFSISTEGNLLVVGAPKDRGKDGSAFIYQRTETTWVEVAKLASEDSENFGHAVVGHVDIVAVADNLNGSGGKGSVFVYHYSSDLLQWGLSEIISNDDCGGRFGDSLEMTNDTDLVIGCTLDNGNTGAVYYYKRNVAIGVYDFRQKIVPQDEEGVATTMFGQTLAADGKFMAVGTGEEFNGKVYLYTLDDDDAWKRVAKIPAPSSNYTYFGAGTELSGDNLFVSYWGNVYSYHLFCPAGTRNK